MKTSLDCIHCFYNQAYRTLKLIGIKGKKQEEILNKVSILVSESDLNVPPPVIAEKVYKLITEETSIYDPFKYVKKSSNVKALKLYELYKNIVYKSDDSLLMAVKFAVLGNIMDFGVSGDFDIEKELDNAVNKDFKVFDYEFFKKILNKSRRILYLGDNAGEIVFDKILIERIIEERKIYFAVREEPIINDVLVEDAKFCGLDKVCKIISSGSKIPGTFLKRCSNNFLQNLRKTDIVISKGQGNLETLIEEKLHVPIFYMLKAKCKVVADKLHCNVGDIILKRG